MSFSSEDSSLGSIVVPFLEPTIPVTSEQEAQLLNLFVALQDRVANYFANPNFDNN